jgi:hypothetical protein
MKGWTFKTSLIIVLIISSKLILAQSKELSKNRYVFRLLPSWSKNIYGIALGPIGSDAVCDAKYPMKTHGVNIQLIGQGIIQPFLIKYLDAAYSDKDEKPDSNSRIAIINGISVSGFGTWTYQVNGINLSTFMGAHKKVNGLSFHLLWNYVHQSNGINISLVNQSGKVNGLQIGLINKTQKLNGIQIGLWNKNAKRSFPIINID